ncbi:hypothetical protein A6770_17090 [Nostoc minutum NIES-26]|uniref:Uncharacterized protein n=1 Tax=Nostoc minutum NIES-26 TaxID=1844469 RepID=A0A367RHK3_9NOSO|nr:hypothetical protein A6770_17090 [Nostoc minutum NIES-26]
MQRNKVSLDLFWLRDKSLEDSDRLPAPDVLALEIAEDLEAAWNGYTLFDSYKQSASMVQETNSYINEARKELAELKNSQSNVNSKIGSLQKEIQQLKNTIQELENRNRKAIVQSPVPESSSSTTRNIQSGR